MHDFLSHVEAYGATAGVLVLAATLFLFALFRRYTVTGPRAARYLRRR